MKALRRYEDILLSYVKLNHTFFLGSFGALMFLIIFTISLAFLEGGEKVVRDGFEEIGLKLLATDLSTLNVDVNEIKSYIQRIDELEDVAASCEGEALIKHVGRSSLVNIKAVDVNINKLTDIKIIKGRNIDFNDIERKNNVIVLDDLTAYRMFNTIDILGKEVLISIGQQSNRASIIGVYKNSYSYLRSALDKSLKGNVLVPLYNAEDLGIDTKLAKAVFLVQKNSDTEMLKARIAKLTGQDKSAITNIKHSYPVYNILKKYSLVMLLSFFLLIIIIIPTLLGNAYNYVNSCKEIISIKKVYGASDKDIFYEVLFSIIIFGMIIGILSLLLSVGIIILISVYLKVSMEVNAIMILFIIAISILISYFVGLLPARYASMVKPTDLFK